jgi:hypothetical protein
MDRSIPQLTFNRKAGQNRIIYRHNADFKCSAHISQGLNQPIGDHVGKAVYSFSIRRRLPFDFDAKQI